MTQCIHYQKHIIQLSKIKIIEYLFRELQIRANGGLITPDEYVIMHDLLKGIYPENKPYDIINYPVPTDDEFYNAQQHIIKDIHEFCRTSGATYVKSLAMFNLIDLVGCVPLGDAICFSLADNFVGYEYVHKSILKRREIK